ncbi:MAG: PaaI family thioesterase [Bdellovibrionota bacterium]
MEKSLQDTYAPNGRCFGCGPKNEKGLKIKSFVEGQEVVAEFVPELHHEAFENVLNGGIIGSVLDCHCNWAAAYFIKQYEMMDSVPCTVTAQYTIKLLRPTPSNQKLHLVARLDKIEKDRAWIKGELRFGEKVGATCEGLFVAVKPDHPAYHRW